MQYLETMNKSNEIATNYYKTVTRIVYVSKYELYNTS